MSRSPFFTPDRKMVLALGAMTLVSMAMLLARIAYAAQLTHVFLPWNLFLAWLPVAFARLAQRQHRAPLRLAGLGGLWLLFLPNAPYLITDLIHLQASETVPLWYDAVMLFAFALSGLLLGAYSLHLTQRLVSGRLGVGAGWLFVLTAAGLSGFGIYIGRFLRWNSWDVFVHPYRLSVGVVHSLTVPELQLKALVTVLLFGVILAAAQVFIFPTVERESG